MQHAEGWYGLWSCQVGCESGSHVALSCYFCTGHCEVHIPAHLLLLFQHGHHCAAAAAAAPQVSFVEQWQGQPLMSISVITCMDVIKQALDEVGFDLVMLEHACMLGGPISAA